MHTEDQIEAAAAAAAEKANGGTFSDPLFYKPEHRAFWREVICAALDAAGARSPITPTKSKPSANGATQKISPKEVEDFSGHCVFVRSVYRFALRLWRDSDEGERNDMEAVAPLFFEDMGQVLNEFMVTAACRITDPAIDPRGYENLTVELFVQDFHPESDTHRQLDELHKRMQQHRVKILPARNKLGAHADREIIRKGQPLGAASWKEWDDFWSALRDFVRILNEQMIGKPFEIDAGGVLGDAETLLKALRQSRHFETLLNGEDAAAKKACIAVALANSTNV